MTQQATFSDFDAAAAMAASELRSLV